MKQSFPRKRESRITNKRLYLLALDSFESRAKCNTCYGVVAMGTHYSHLSLEERIELYALMRLGRSIRAAADHLGRSPSTISRELRRNSNATKQFCGGYRPERAHGLAARRRRWDARFKLARQPALRALVRDRLAMGWSPQQIAGRLARQHAPMRISHESIYRYIYHRSAQKDYWHKLLAKAKHRRGRLGPRGGSAKTLIAHRVSLDKRPKSANQRRQFGHWEADLMLFSRYGQAVLVAHERKSRLTWIWRQPNKAARPVVERLKAAFATLPPALRRSITFDNGSEFYLHHELNQSPGMATYFCDTHSPWQKGGIENAIHRLRRVLPRKSDLATIDQAELDRLVTQYNQTPRKCLDYRTPQEVFTQISNRVALQT